MTTYTLKTPVTHDGTTVSSLTFRKPKVGDLMTMDKFTGETEKLIALLASTSDTTIPVFKEIDLEDFNGIVAAMGDNLGNSPASTATGSTS